MKQPRFLPVLILLALPVTTVYAATFRVGGDRSDPAFAERVETWLTEFAATCARELPARDGVSKPVLVMLRQGHLRLPEHGILAGQWLYPLPPVEFDRKTGTIQIQRHTDPYSMPYMRSHICHATAVSVLQTRFPQLRHKRMTWLCEGLAAWLAAGPEQLNEPVCKRQRFLLCLAALEQNKLLSAAKLGKVTGKGLRKMKPTERELFRAQSWAMVTLNPRHAPADFLGLSDRALQAVLSSTEWQVALQKEAKKHLCSKEQGELTSAAPEAEKTQSVVPPDSSLKPHMQDLRSKELKIRAGAAEALGKVGDRSALEPLIQVALNDPSWQVRDTAATGIARLNFGIAPGALLAATSQRKDLKRSGRAMQALGGIGDQIVIEEVIRVSEGYFIATNFPKAWITHETTRPYVQSYQLAPGGTDLEAVLGQIRQGTRLRVHVISAEGRIFTTEVVSRTLRRIIPGTNNQTHADWIGWYGQTLAQR